MSFFNDPKNNGIKVLMIVIVLAIAAFFVYTYMHDNALLGTGQVASLNGRGGTGASLNGTGSTGGTSATTTTGGTNPGTTGTTTSKGSTTGVTDPRCDQSTVVRLVPSYVAGSSVSSIPLNPGTGASNNDVAIGTFRLNNPGDCPMKVTMIKFVAHPSMVPSPTYSMLQNIRLVEASTGAAFGSALPFTTPIDMVGNLPFTSTTGVIIAPHTSADFNLITDGRNVPPPARFRIQMTAFNAINTVTSLLNNALYPTSMGMVAGPFVTFVP